MLKPRLSFLLGLLLFIPTLLLAVDLKEQALESERRGDIEHAVELYTRWLAANPGNPAASDVLLHAAGLAGSYDLAILMLETHVSAVDDDDRSGVYRRIADLASMGGDPEKAARYYRKAAEESVPGISYQRLMFDSLVIQYTMGENEQVYREIRTLLPGISDRVLLSDFLALQASALLSGNREDDAFAVLKPFQRNSPDDASPLFWLALGDVSAVVGDEESYALARSKLDTNYPESVADYVMGNRILRWTTPALLFDSGGEKPGSRYVQTGAFSNREAAASLRRTLEDDGFTSWIELDQGLWKVYVNDSDGRTGERLKNAGYDYSIAG